MALQQFGDVIEQVISTATVMKPRCYLRFVCVWLVALSITPASASAQQPLNGDFERLSVEGTTRPWNWTPIEYAPGAEVRVDDDVFRSGRRSLRFSRSDAGRSDGTHSFATYLHSHAMRGRTIRVTAWIKGEAETDAYITAQAWADFSVLETDTSRAAALQEDWVRHDVEIAVPVETETVVITANLRGMGLAWFDDLVLEVDGKVLSSVPIARDVGSDEIDWIAPYANPLRTLDATKIGDRSNDDDLAPVASIVGDARLVALGESTHGTSEFFRLKHRVLEYLVTELGFRMFAIEDQQLGMERINAYVQGGSGTIAEVMRELFGVWNTAEVRSLIEWMRAYNLANPDDSVEFVGFDMQNPSIPIDSLLAFTERNDPMLHPTMLLLLSDYREAWRRAQYPQYTVGDSVHHRWADGAEAAWRLAESRSGEWYRRASSSEDSAVVSWAVQNARVAAQAGRYIFGNQPDRDSAMVENLKWHLDRRGSETRAVVWAHDSHISKGTAATTQGNYFISSMGQYLDRLYGDDYRSFGIMSYAGSYTAVRSMWGGPRDLAIIDAFPAPAGSLEEIFHRVADRIGSPSFVLDLRPALSDPMGRAMREQRPYRFVGYAAEDFGFSGVIEVARQFDGLFFIDVTSGTRPIGVSPWPPRED